jgi:hypothetical protein
VEACVGEGVQGSCGAVGGGSDGICCHEGEDAE